MRRVFEDGAYADRALRSAAAGSTSATARSPVSLAYGTIQRARTLDHAIETLGRRPVHRLDPPVRAALRLGAYQLAFLDGVPRYAAVNESVELVRRARLERAVPFANAVLRRLAEAPGSCSKGCPRRRSGGRAASLVPGLDRRDVVAGARARRGPRADGGAERGAGDGRTARRGARSTGSGGSLIPGAWVVDRVDETALAEGRIWPQSRASQLVGHAVGSREGERTLDLCAAPGGKATMLAGEVVAVEVDEARAEQLEENARRLGATGVRVVRADGRDLPPELDGFDRALVDAPCSGLGVLAARPDLRWRAEPLPELQLELLRAAIARTRPGGVVVYATCTINAAECEDGRRRCRVRGGWPTVDATLGDEWPAFRHRSRPAFLQTLPHVHATSGFFVARLVVS